jgi:predicted adenylyl cyclase CyaB
MKEVETRNNFNDNELEYIEKFLLDNDFKNVDEYIQHDVMLDYPDGRLFKSGGKIRVRKEKGKLELTHKGLFEGDSSFSRRTEVNIPIEEKSFEDLITLFKSIGFPMLFQIVKNRKKYISEDGIIATIDNWPIIGYVLELEGEEENINKLLEKIDSKFAFDNTRLKDLFKNKAIKENKDIKTLKSEYEEKAGILLGNLDIILD